MDDGGKPPDFPADAPFVNAGGVATVALDELMLVLGLVAG